MTLDTDAAEAVEGRLWAPASAPGDELVVVSRQRGQSVPALAARFVRVADRHARARRRRAPRGRRVGTVGERRGGASHRTRRARRSTPADRDRVLPPQEFTLAELRALVDRAALYIGGDSGPLHIASTTTAPIVGLYGPTLPVRSEPWRVRRGRAKRRRCRASSAVPATSASACTATFAVSPGSHPRTCSRRPSGRSLERGLRLARAVAQR